MIRESYHPTKDKLKKIDELCRNKDCLNTSPCEDCEINKEYKILTRGLIGLEDLNGDDIYGGI